MEPPRVALDLSATQKYVLITLSRPSLPDEVYLRGAASAEYHADVRAEFEPTLLSFGGPGARVSCPGGGRITFTAPSTYRVHGYSMAFGKADHAASAKLLQAHLPQATITFDDEGY